MRKLEVKNLNKIFGETKAVDDISFSAQSGKVFALVGRNGAGKTTTIRMITDIYVPDSGEILFDGGKRGDDFHKRVGYLPEERGLYKFMSVMDNLLFLAEIKGIDPTISRPKALGYLKRFDLTEKADHPLDALSKGNQQKVQFIGTILHDPDLVILDEPFSGLDPVNTNLFKDVILELRQANKIVILSTHQMDIAEKICDQMALVNRGKLILNSTVSEIKQRYSASMVTLRAEGDLGFLDSLDYVTAVEHFGVNKTIQVRHDTDIQLLLQELLRHKIIIKQFVANEMSLHDIFVSLTRTKEEMALDAEARLKNATEDAA